MAEVKAQFPIGKTQWAKWGTMQRNAFNTLREQGKDFNTAVALANTMVDVFEEFKPKAALPEKTETAKPVPPVKKPAPQKKAK
jgi:hypothetical protein